MINISINGRKLNVLIHSTILQACKTNGINIPHFCYHENLSVAGNCRICLVEVYKSPKPVVSCAIPVSNGIIIYTETPLVRKARESVLEFLLLNHPLDCPICDQGSECDLQDETIIYASDRSRFFIFKQTIEDKACGPIIKTIITRCIHCTRCVRFCAEVAGTPVIGNFGRGEKSEIGTYINSFIKTELSGNLVDICPVGALTSKPYSFKARQWDLQQKNTIDFFDTILSEIIVCTTASNNHYKNKLNFKAKIRRILPNTNSIYTENWISDRTRYAFDSLDTRLTTPNLWNFHSSLENINNVESTYFKSNTINVIFFNSHTNLEIISFIINFYKQAEYYNFTQSHNISKLPNDLPTFYTLNQKVTQFISQKLNLILIIGINLRYEASLLNTRLRRKQIQTNLNLRTIAAFDILNCQQNHQGNTSLSLLAIKENRISFVKAALQKKERVTLIYGETITRHKYGLFIQQLILQLSKYFFVKTKTQNRFGIIHNSVGSLAFSHIGFKTIDYKYAQINEHIAKIKQINVGANNINKSFIYNYFNKRKSQSFTFDTHYIETNIEGLKNNLYPTTSFYERSGSLLSVDNLIRQHNKVLNVNEKNVNNIESYYIYWIAKNKGNRYIYSLLKKRDQFNNITGFNIKNINIAISFTFNPFNRNFTSCGKSIFYAPVINNFYLDAPLANASQTIGACALFLNQENNFTAEI